MRAKSKTLSLLSVILLAGLTVHAQEKPKPVFYGNPDWSHDGSRILFESTRDGKYSIYTIAVDGTDLRRLTNDEFNNEQPRWSRDGRKIVFISDRDDHLQLYIMDGDGSNQRRLTNAADIDYSPDFSPDGAYVVFNSRPRRVGVGHDIYIIRSDGTGRTRLTNESTIDSTGPRWSPDGKHIAFVRSTVIRKTFQEMSKEDMALMQKSRELFVMERDGSNARNLTNNDVRDCCPVWSKDSKTIYLKSERDGAPKIYSMSAGGSNVKLIADVNASASANISPDGKYLVYGKQVDGDFGIYTYELKTGKEHLVIGGQTDRRQ